MRRAFCKHYTDCLDGAAKKNAPGFDCSGCDRYRFDGQLKTDFTEFYLLLWAIFKPELFAAAMEAIRQQRLDNRW